MIRSEKDTFGPRTLYVAYWGAAEPLGRSLVIPAVRRLARLGVVLTLVTFEKPRDWQRRADIEGIRRALESDGVRWMPCLYHKRPKVPATAFDLARGVAQGLLASGRQAFDIVHARTFVGGLMGLALAPMLGAKLVYHNEGFYPDEQVDGGVWREGSLPHRLARWLERRLYERAAGVIAVSERGRRVIADLPRVRRRATPVAVVPSCIDLDAFPRPSERRDRAAALRFVHIGSVGARYMLDAMARFVTVAGRELGSAELRVCTRENPDVVRDALIREGLAPESVSVGFVPHAEISRELGRHDVGLFFLKRGLSEHGCSPTKIGEYWACGLPVVCTANVGDVDEIVRRDRVGAIVDGHTDEHYRGVVRRLPGLLAEEDLSARCRAAAERHYDLATGCDRQIELYRQILRAPEEATAAASAGLPRPLRPS